MCVRVGVGGRLKVERYEEVKTARVENEVMGARCVRKGDIVGQFRGSLGR